MDEMSRVSKKNQVIVKYMRYNFIFKNSKNTQNQTHVWDKAMYGKSIKFKKVSISERRGRHMSAVHGRSKDVGNVPFLNLVIGGGLQMLTLPCTYMLHISFGINNIFANFLKKQLSLILYRNYIYLRVSLVAQTVKNLPTMQETWVRSVGWEDPLEEGMSTHSNILPWRILMDRGAWWAPVPKSWT